MFWQAHCSTALRGVSSMNTHIHEFFRGMTAAGKERAPADHDRCPSSRFFTRVRCNPDSQRGSFLSGLQKVPYLREIRIRKWPCDSMAHRSLSADLVAVLHASRQSFGLERQSKKSALPMAPHRTTTFLLLNGTRTAYQTSPPQSMNNHIRSKGGIET